jgi:molybdopterin-guanine dinucleotide biosynthesis protein B
MKRLHIVGGKNHGKTTLVVDLVRALVARGVCVGTIKHTHHRHELDVPGKDSFRHREAGASAVGILSPALSAMFIPTDVAGDASGDRYSAFAPLFAHCEFVLVEGDSQSTAPKIEVWRAAAGTPPLVQTDGSILAVVTDDSLSLSLQTTILSRSRVDQLAEWILHNVRAWSSS